jgi:pimeloyl-ACP methyl ester carboxylesterase
MLAFERHGSGEPLILIHGITHRRQAWYPVLDSLTDHREVVLIDLPGHGDSPPLVSDGRPVEEILRAEFRQFLQDQQLDRPHVAGNSLGGRIALEAGAAGDARSVTCLSPAGFWRTQAEFAYTRRLFLSMAALGRRLAPNAPRLSRTAAGRTLMYGWITAHPTRISADQALGDFRAFIAARPAMDDLLAAATPFTRTIPADVPVTIAWAGRDAVLPRWQAAAARARLPAATHLLLPGVGHVPMSDDPSAVAGVLLRGSAPVAARPSPVEPLRR